MDQKETNTSQLSGTTFSGLMGILKIPLLFAPFVFLRGCASGPHYAFEIVQFLPTSFLAMQWPFLFVLAATPVAIILLTQPRQVTNFVRSTKFGLAISVLSLLGWVWTGYVVANPDGDLMWGFWALLACDIGMIGGYAYDLNQLSRLQQPFSHDT